MPTMASTVLIEKVYYGILDFYGHKERDLFTTVTNLGLYAY